MSAFTLGCGHQVDGHCIEFITIEGFKAFKSWKWKYGRVLWDKLCSGKGVYKSEYLHLGGDLNYKTICTSCLGEWINSTGWINSTRR